MALGETFDLAKVIGAAEQIKGMRRDAEDDAIRRQYLQTQLAGAQQAQSIQKEEHAVQMDERSARRSYYLSQAVLGAADPKAAAETIAPDFVQQFDQTHGAGSWANLTPAQAVQAAQAIQAHAVGIIGPQQKVKWIDSGGQQIAVDEVTGQPLQGVSPITKSASPDSLLSAQTSTANAQLSAATAQRGQNIAAQTAQAGRATTERGQDLTARTARETAGAKVTETQGNAKAFGLRATEANKALELLISPKDKGGGGYQPTGVSAAFDAMTAGHLTTNWLSSSAGQKYQNVAKAFIAPILRKESGAAISDSEWASAKQLYVPWPGDDAEVLAQKAENRTNAIQGLAEQAGPAGIPARRGGASGGWSIEPVN